MPPAMAATESDDVFVARMHSCDTACSSPANSACFTSSRSTTASITRPHSAYAAKSFARSLAFTSRFTMAAAAA